MVQHATGARMRLQNAAGNRPRICLPRRAGKSKSASDLVGKAIAESRQLISGLRPPVLDEMGIVAAVEYLIGQQPEGGPAIRFDADVRLRTIGAGAGEHDLSDRARGDHQRPPTRPVGPRRDSHDAAGRPDSIGDTRLGRRIRPGVRGRGAVTVCKECASEPGCWEAGRRSRARRAKAPGFTWSCRWFPVLGKRRTQNHR